MTEEIKSYQERLREQESEISSLKRTVKNLVDAFYADKKVNINRNINSLLDGALYNQCSARLNFSDVVEGISLTVHDKNFSKAKETIVPTQPYIYLVGTVMESNWRFFNYIVLPYGDDNSDWLRKDAILYELRRRFELAFMNKISQILVNLNYIVSELMIINSDPCIDVSFFDEDNNAYPIMYQKDPEDNN